MLKNDQERRVLGSAMQKIIKTLGAINPTDLDLMLILRSSENLENIIKKKRVVVFCAEERKIMPRELIKKLFKIPFTAEELAAISGCSDEERWAARMRLLDDCKLKLTTDLRLAIRK